MPEKAKTPRASKYPWDEWLDGSAWEVSQGDGYTCTPDAFVTNLRRKAIDETKAGRPISVTLQRSSADTTIIFQFIPKNTKK